MRVAGFFLAAILLGGCSQQRPSGRVSVAAKESSDFVKFPVEDCVVYRFYDGFRYSYFMRCPNAAKVDGSTCHYEMRGKIPVLICAETSVIGKP